MKKFINSIIMAAALTIVWGCSSDSDDVTTASDFTPVSNPPKWEVKFTLPKGQTGKPNWEQVDFYQFENTMTIVLHLEEEMMPFLSEDDQMAAFVDGQLREIADIQFVTTGENQQRSNLFMLLVPYAEQDKYVDLYYYNAKTQQTWLITTTTLRDDNTLGSEYDYVVGLFTLGNLTAILSGDVPFTPAAGDELGLFVDDVCCGVGQYDAEQQMWNIKAYNLGTENTQAHFRYYSAEKSGVYKTSVMIDFKTIHRSVQTPYVLSF